MFVFSVPVMDKENAKPRGVQTGVKRPAASPCHSSSAKPLCRSAPRGAQGPEVLSTSHIQADISPPQSPILAALEKVSVVSEQSLSSVESLRTELQTFFSGDRSEQMLAALHQLLERVPPAGSLEARIGSAEEVLSSLRARQSQVDAEPLSDQVVLLREELREARTQLTSAEARAIAREQTSLDVIATLKQTLQVERGRSEMLEAECGRLRDELLRMKTAVALTPPVLPAVAAPPAVTPQQQMEDIQRAKRARLEEVRQQVRAAQGSPQLSGTTRMNELEELQSMLRRKPPAS